MSEIDVSGESWHTWKLDTAPISKQELLMELRRVADKSHGLGSATEKAHIEADALLLRYIADEEIQRAYVKILRWYS
jgi:hypothetical protein